MTSTTSLSSLLNPKGVAVVGASQRGGRGAQGLANLRRFGFAGAIYAVNPHYEEVEGYKCASVYRTQVTALISHRYCIHLTILLRSRYGFTSLTLRFYCTHYGTHITAFTLLRSRYCIVFTLPQRLTRMILATIIIHCDANRGG